MPDKRPQRRTVRANVDSGKVTGVQVDMILCDHAQISGDKLFISGGGLVGVLVADPAADVFPVSFFAAAMLSFSPLEMGTPHVVSLQVVTEDGTNPVLNINGTRQRQAVVSGQLHIEVTPGPGALPGADVSMPAVFGFQHVPFADRGRYDVQLLLDGQPAHHLPWSVTSRP